MSYQLPNGPGGALARCTTPSLRRCTLLRDVARCCATRWPVPPATRVRRRERKRSAQHHRRLAVWWLSVMDSQAKRCTLRSGAIERRRYRPVQACSAREARRSLIRVRPEVRSSIGACRATPPQLGSAVLGSCSLVDESETVRSLVSLVRRHRKSCEQVHAESLLGALSDACPCELPLAEVWPRS